MNKCHKASNISNSTLYLNEIDKVIRYTDHNYTEWYNTYFKKLELDLKVENIMCNIDTNGIIVINITYKHGISKHKKQP